MELPKSLPESQRGDVAGPPPTIDRQRRDFIQRLGAVLGGSVLASLLPGLPQALAYEARPDTLDSAGAVLDQTRLRTLHALCSQTLPTTDTPGAAELDVHGFVDSQLAACHGPEDQGRAGAVLDGLEDAGRAAGHAFAELDDHRQLDLLTAAEAGKLARHGITREDFKFLKGLVVFGYFTSEVGATQLLRWDPFPGGFDGDYPWPSDGRAWY